MEKLSARQPRLASSRQARGCTGEGMNNSHLLSRQCRGKRGQFHRLPPGLLLALRSWGMGSGASQRHRAGVHQGPSWAQGTLAQEDTATSITFQNRNGLKAATKIIIAWKSVHTSSLLDPLGTLHAELPGLKLLCPQTP